MYTSKGAVDDLATFGSTPRTVVGGDAPVTVDIDVKPAIGRLSVPRAQGVDLADMCGEGCPLLGGRGLTKFQGSSIVRAEGVVLAEMHGEATFGSSRLLGSRGLTKFMGCVHAEGTVLAEISGEVTFGSCPLPGSRGLTKFKDCACAEGMTLAEMGGEATFGNSPLPSGSELTKFEGCSPIVRSSCIGTELRKGGNTTSAEAGDGCV